MKFWLLAVLLVGVVLPALGRDGFDQRRALFADRFHAQFIAADKDQSGTLSKEEAQAIPFIIQHFKELDVNEDGEITWEELRDYTTNAKAARRAAFERRQSGIESPPAPEPAP